MIIYKHGGRSGELINATLRFKWFDLIRRGSKKIEYRVASPYWDSRLIGHDIKFIRFSKGYSKTTMTVEVLKIEKMIVDNYDDFGNSPEGTKISMDDIDENADYLIYLGRVLQVTDESGRVTRLVD